MDHTQTVRLKELLPLLREMRRLGLTKYEDDVFQLEFGASVVISEDASVSRAMDEDEEERIAMEFMRRKKDEHDADLFGAG